MNLVLYLFRDLVAVRVVMRKEFISTLVLSIVVFSLPIVPIAQMSRPVSYPVAGPIRTSEFLRDLAESAVSENSDLFATQAKKIAGVIAKPAKRSPIVIDQTGNDRDLIMSAAAAKIRSIAPEKRVLSIDWTGVFEKARSENDVDAAVSAILLQAESSKGNDILYIDDVAIFSTERSRVLMYCLRYLPIRTSA